MHYLGLTSDVAAACADYLRAKRAADLAWKDLVRVAETRGVNTLHAWELYQNHSLMQEGVQLPLPSFEGTK
jgi:hypothetical protein